MFVDTHCHLDDEKFAQFLTAKDLGLDKVKVAITMGCNLKGSVDCKNLSEKFDNLYFGAGFHPGNQKDYNKQDFISLKELFSHPKCVAVGEIGLDYHWEPFDKQKQSDLLILQLDLADKLDLPVSLHSRDSTLDMINVLKSFSPKSRGVMHCFSGSKETAKILLDLGYYISFAGTLTFKNAVNLKEVASYVPMDRILTETDSPYLAPHPLRGTLNSPSNIGIICDTLAQIKGVSIEEMAKTVYQNTKTLFKKII